MWILCTCKSCSFCIRTKYFFYTHLQCSIFQNFERQLITSIIPRCNISYIPKLLSHCKLFSFLPSLLLLLSYILYVNYYYFYTWIIHIQIPARSRTRDTPASYEMFSQSRLLAWEARQSIIPPRVRKQWNTGFDRQEWNPESAIVSGGGGLEDRSSSNEHQPRSARDRDISLGAFDASFMARKRDRLGTRVVNVLV